MLYFSLGGSRVCGEKATAVCVLAMDYKILHGRKFLLHILMDEVKAYKRECECNNISGNVENRHMLCAGDMMEGKWCENGEG